MGKTKGRLGYLDALKGVAMILVVFCHLPELKNESIIGNLFMSLSWCAVPCFFMVTGGLMHRSRSFSWKKYLGRLLKTYITIVIWKLLFLGFYMLRGGVTFDFTQFIKYTFFMGFINNVVTAQLWFMNAYIQALLIYPITYFLFKDEKNGKKALLFLMVILWCCSVLPCVVHFFGIYEMDMLFTLIPFTGYTNMIFFFILGVYLLEYKERIDDFINKNVMTKCLSSILIIVGTIGITYVKYTQCNSIRWDGFFLVDGYNRFSTMLAAIGLYLFFSQDYLSKVDWVLRKIGENTLGIFYLHWPVLVIYRDIANGVFPNYFISHSFTLHVVHTLIVIMLCVVITEIGKKIPTIKGIFK